MFEWGCTHCKGLWTTVYVGDTDTPIGVSYLVRSQVGSYFWNCAPLWMKDFFARRIECCACPCMELAVDCSEENVLDNEQRTFDSLLGRFLDAISS